uniref:TIL domain-containing protein n=1 Tax=Heterorhabditis bacteriophora TaxID=37862 RepID=A0A1I7X4Y4_HETBA
MSTSNCRLVLWLHVFFYMKGQWSTAQQSSGTQQVCTMVCPVTGYVCVVRTLVCNSAVCPTISECVPGDPANNCSTISCPSGSQCVYVTQTCTTSTCYPRPECTSQGSSTRASSSTVPITQSSTRSQSSASSTTLSAVTTSSRPISTTPSYVLPPEGYRPASVVMGSSPSNDLLPGSSMNIQLPTRPSSPNTNTSPAPPSMGTRAPSPASPSGANNVVIRPPARPSSYAVSSGMNSRAASASSFFYNRIFCGVSKFSEDTTRRQDNYN